MAGEGEGEGEERKETGEYWVEKKGKKTSDYINGRVRRR